MPLTVELEDLLKTISDEGDRNVLRQQLEKHAPLREGYLRQADYDRKMNQAKAEREAEKVRVAAAEETANKWSDWAKRNEPKHTQLMSDYEKSQARLKELEEKVKTAAAVHSDPGGNNGGGANVDPDVLMAKVKEEIATRGFVSAADLPKLINEEASKIAANERKEFFDKTLPSWSKYMFQLNDIASEHRSEFGERFDRDAFIKFQNEANQPDVLKAYESYVATKRQEVWKKNETERITKELISKQPLPGSGVMPASELGPVQANRQHKIPELPADARLGDGSAANAAAAELRSEGKF